MSDVGWVRRAETNRHRCPAPTGSLGVPLGTVDDLWRCPTCRTLWRIVLACNLCDAYGARPHRGMHDVGYAWRPATAWQRLTVRIRGRG
jgi:hypothetical protein